MNATCHELHQLLHGLPRFTYPYDDRLIPSNGVYVLFEQGETAHGGDRIVRIGSHTGPNNLPPRLREHFENPNKDRSIFRKNIGRVLLSRDGDPFLRYWNIPMTTRKNKDRYSAEIDWEKQRQVEERVTAYIHDHFSFVAIPVLVGDPERRKHLERRLIGTVSLCSACRPSEQWLGRHATRKRIREGGLWQEQHIFKTPLSAWDLDVVREILRPG